jgi:hypothetical protein
MIEIDKTLANFIKEIYTQQRGNVRNKEKGPKLEQKNKPQSGSQWSIR